LVEVAAVASAAALRASTVDVAEAASEEDWAAVEEDSETAAETLAVVVTEAAMAHPAMPHPDLDLIAETAATAIVTAVIVAIVATVVIAATEGVTEALVGMIREVVVAHMTTDRAAAIVMLVDSAENARTDVPEATWNPSADEKVGIARGTETTTDLATTTLAVSADTKVVTRIPESCDATKQCLSWTYGGGLSISSFSH
jgi:hypothetical protein